LICILSWAGVRLTCVQLSCSLACCLLLVDC
jgi:hypothetical protein